MRGFGGPEMAQFAADARPTHATRKVSQPHRKSPVFRPGKAKRFEPLALMRRYIRM